MGIFSRFVDAVRDVASSVKDKVVEAIHTARNLIDDIVRKSSKKTGSRGPMEDDIDSRARIENELLELKKKVEKQAKILEESKIKYLTVKFDLFLGELEKIYPELCQLLKDKKTYMILKQRGIIMNYVYAQVSENNSSFRKILEMESDDAKEKKVAEKISAIISRAQSVFDKKLEEQMGILNDELETRLGEEFKKKEELLQNEITIYEELQKQILDGEVDLEKYQTLYQYSKEVKECLKVLCEKGK